MIRHQDADAQTFNAHRRDLPESEIGFALSSLVVATWLALQTGQILPPRELAVGDLAAGRKAALTRARPSFTVCRVLAAASCPATAYRSYTTLGIQGR
jgi:hypothetical protein